MKIIQLIAFLFINYTLIGQVKKDNNVAVLQNSRWNEIQEKMVGKLPDVIVLEFFNDNEPTTNKQSSFVLNGAKYSLDSCIIRDTKKNHFSSLLTCEKKEMAYDGMSFHRLTYMDWKDKINTDFKWQFKGSEDGGKLLTWNFAKGYYMLIYYRV